jgi:hypothetical protein
VSLTVGTHCELIVSGFNWLVLGIYDAAPTLELCGYETRQGTSLRCITVFFSPSWLYINGQTVAGVAPINNHNDASICDYGSLIHHIEDPADNNPFS